MAQTMIDPAAAERAALETKLTGLAGQIALYTRARDAVRQKIAKIDVEELRPIEVELDVFNRAAAEAEARVAEIEWLSLAPKPEDRARRFNEAKQMALSAYRRAQAQAPNPDAKAVAEGEWSAVDAVQQSAVKQKPDSGRISGGEMDAWFRRFYATGYKRYLALAKRMDEFAAQPPARDPELAPVHGIADTMADDGRITTLG